MRTALMVCAAAAVLMFGVPASPAFADDSAMQQLQDEAHSSNDAANASSDEEAKDLSNQGFDTPNNDPAPQASDDQGSSGNDAGSDDSSNDTADDNSSDDNSADDSSSDDSSGDDSSNNDN